MCVATFGPAPARPNAVRRHYHQRATLLGEFVGPDEQQHGGSLHAAISDAVVRITADYTGRGPTRARTTINGDWVFVTLSDTLTKGERKLAALGRAQFVNETRKAFQDAMRDDFVAEVEALTGRPVTAFLSDNHIDPDVAVECFQLAPRADGA